VPNAGALTVRVMASSYSTTEPSIILDAVNTAATSGANPSLSVTPSRNGAVIVDAMCNGFNSDPTANSQTLLYENDEGAWSSNAQYAQQVTAASIALGYTVNTEDYGFIVAAFVEGHAGTLVTNNSLIRGGGYLD
jgi:hypothetical protein